MFIDDLDHQERIHVEQVLSQVRQVQAEQDPAEFHSTMDYLKQVVDGSKLNEREKMALIELLLT